MAEGVTVGDGVLKFLADTTSLDAGYQKVDQAPEHLKPAAAAVDDLGNKFSKAGRDAKKAGQDIEEGAKKAEYSTKEATGTIALLGEETGVKLPRHIRGFVAELPGVGKALSAAFEATAVLILIQLLIEAAEKVTEFVSDNFIFTESMKESNKMIAEGNVKLLEYKKQLEELKKQYILIGLEGSAKFRAEIGFLNKDLADQKKQFEELGKSVIQLAKNEESLTLQRIASEGFFARYKDKVMEFFGAESKARAEVRKEIAAAQQQYIDLSKQIEVTTQKEKNLHKELNQAVVKETEVLKEKYDAAVLKTKELLKEQQKLLQQFDELAMKGQKAQEIQIENTPIIVKQIDDLIKAYQTLGFQGIDTVAMKIRGEQQAVADIEKAYKAHLATMHDVHVAKLILVQDEIKLAAAQGKSTKALEKEEAALKKQIPEMKQYGKTAHDVAAAAGSAIIQSALAWGQGAITITQALQQIAAAVLQSVAQIAEKKGVEQLALGFGSWPDFAAMSHHLAAAGLWFGLAGGISATAGAVGGGSATPGTQANPVSTTSTADNSPATQKQQAPIGVVGLQHFASGGLVTGPTLGMLGDNPSHKELAIPLDDPQAKEHIRDAVGGGGDGDIHVHVKGLISPDNLKKVVKKMDGMVKGRKVFLTSSNSHRLTKRSQ